MNYLILHQKTKKLLFLFSVVLCFCCLSLGSVTVSASGTPPDPEPIYYQITESELTQLETNLAQLKAANTKLQLELTAQKRQLHVLREESKLLLSQLNNLKQHSETQESSLTKANKLLAEYATEAKRERLKIKAQRNSWIAATVVSCIALVIK